MLFFSYFKQPLPFRWGFSIDILLDFPCLRRQSGVSPRVFNIIAYIFRDNEYDSTGVCVQNCDVFSVSACLQFSRLSQTLHACTFIFFAPGLINEKALWKTTRLAFNCSCLCRPRRIVSLLVSPPLLVFGDGVSRVVGGERAPNWLDFLFPHNGAPCSLPLVWAGPCRSFVTTRRRALGLRMGGACLVRQSCIINPVFQH